MCAEKSQGPAEEAGRTGTGAPRPGGEENLCATRARLMTKPFCEPVWPRDKALGL